MGDALSQSTRMTYTKENKAAIKARFIVELAKTGDVSASTAVAGLSPGGRTVVYAWRKDDVEFAQQWQDALDTCWDALERALISRGKDHSDRAAFGMLKAHRPEIYGDKVDIRLRDERIDLSWPEGEREEGEDVPQGVDQDTTEQP